jgi:hypothetical protein
MTGQRSNQRRLRFRAQRFAVATRQTESSPSRNEAVAPTMHARGPLFFVRSDSPFTQRSGDMVYTSGLD